MTTLTLTDGTTTVDINSTAIVTLDQWVPSTPQLNETVIEHLGDGETLGVPTWRNVTETIPLLLVGNAATIAAALQSVQKLVDAARRNRLTYGNTRLFLQVQFSHDSAVWRSEVLAGRVVPVDPANKLTSGKMEISLILTRRYYWEGASTALEMTSLATTVATTGYVTVYNAAGTASSANWFQVASAQVTGDLPAPLKLDIKNNSGGNRYARGIFVGNYVWMDPTTVQPLLLETAASTDDPTLANTTEKVVYRWLLTDAQVADFNGQYCRVLLTWATDPAAATLFRACLQLGTGLYIDVVVGEQVRAGDEVIMDLGAMPIPPGGAIVTGLEVYLVIKAQSAAGSDTFAANWVQLMPAGHGLFRHLRAMTTSLALGNGDRVIDDGPERIVYATDSTGGSGPWYRGYHAPIHVWPGRTQRMRLMVQGHTALEPGEVWQVSATYRPRRLSV